MPTHSYLTLRPNQIKSAIQASAIAFIPFGALEWHSFHLPLGLDGLKAESLIRMIAEKLQQGIIFPCRYWGQFDVMRFPYTLGFSRAYQAKLYKTILRQMYEMGFRIIIMLTGHYPTTQVNYLKKAALWLMDKYDDAYVLAIPEQMLLWDLGYFGDHAARYETSFALSLFPELVNMQEIPEGLPYIDRCTQLGIMGQDPRKSSSKEEGDHLVKVFIDRIVDLILKVKQENSQQPFREVYKSYEIAVKRLKNLKNLEDARKILGMESNRDFIRHFTWLIFKGGKYCPNPLFE